MSPKHVKTSLLLEMTISTIQRSWGGFLLSPANTTKSWTSLHASSSTRTCINLLTWLFLKLNNASSSSLDNLSSSGLTFYDAQLVLSQVFFTLYHLHCHLCFQLSLCFGYCPLFGLLDLQKLHGVYEYIPSMGSSCGLILFCKDRAKGRRLLIRRGNIIKRSLKHTLLIKDKWK